MKKAIYIRSDDIKIYFTSNPFHWINEVKMQMNAMNNTTYESVCKWNVDIRV